MLLLRPSARLLQQATSSRPSLSSRLANLLAAKPPPPFPVIPSCPSPTCTCSPTPPNLDIDRKTTITNNIPAYDSHILISTGVSDWPSRIEDSASSASNQPAWAKLTTELKEAFGRKGRFHDRGASVLVTASSMGVETGKVITHFPSFRSYSIQDKTADGASGGDADADLNALLTHFTTPPPSASSSSSTTTLPRTITTQQITTPTILVCTHNSRDSRCGILGPLLVSEFQSHLSRLLPSTPTTTTTSNNPTPPPPSSPPIVAGISHIGGHKWAGNVIIYLPPLWPLQHGNPSLSPSTTVSQQTPPSPHQANQPGGVEDKTTTQSPLAAHAIWYGRVEPRHVEGIVAETVFKGRVIGELARGVVDYSGVVDAADGRSGGGALEGSGRARLVRI